MFTAAVADPNILILNDLVFICPENNPLSGSSSQSQQHSNWNQMLQKGIQWPLVLMSKPPWQPRSIPELSGGCHKSTSHCPGQKCHLRCGQLSLASGLAQLTLQRLGRNPCSKLAGWDWI